MKIIEPSVEYWNQGEDVIAHIAKCARVCYGKESGNDKLLYNNLQLKGHHSMLRHQSVYAIIPSYIFRMKVIDMGNLVYFSQPYIKYCTYKENVYVVTNGHYMLDLLSTAPTMYNLIKDFEATYFDAIKCEYVFEHFTRYTFCVVTQISTSRELNRVSPNNIAEQSTRYVYEDGSICAPWWINPTFVSIDDIGHIQTVCNEFGGKDEKALFYLLRVEDSFRAYKYLVDKFNLSKQDARGILPLDTATKCVYTYSIDEWRHIINLRYYGITGAPHPNAKIAAGLIRDKLIELGYDFR